MRANASAVVISLFAGLAIESVSLSDTLAPEPALRVPDSKTRSEKRPSQRIVRVTGPEARRPVEVSVAISPVNPDHVVAVSTQAGRRSEGTSDYVYASQDGGLTWKAMAAANPEHRIQGDDAVTFGPDGVSHRSYISFTGIRTDRPLRAASGIFV